MGPNAFGSGAAADWWLAAGTIALANVLEHVENPAARQLYAGAAATDAWSVSFRTNLADVPVSAMAFDCQDGRIGTSTDGGNGLNFGAGASAISLFVDGDHSYMVVSSGSSVQAYRDNVAIGSAVSSTVNITAPMRWRSRFFGLSENWYEWPVAIRAGHVANVALDATQRAALHAAMAALA